MSLVAYDNSDESEEECPVKKISTKEKKTKEAIKIRIPSLKEFEDDEETPVAKKPKLQSGSGLFSLLPPPKNTSTLSKAGFVPHILSFKKEQPSSASKESQNSKTTKINFAQTVLSEEQEYDDEISFTKDISSEENVNTSKHDFFWLDDLTSKEKSNENENSTLSSDSNIFLQNLSSISNKNTQEFHQTESKITFFQQYNRSTETNTFHVEKKIEQSLSSGEQSYPYESYSVVESDNKMDSKESLLNDKEFLKLQGRRREFENIDIIDVSADDQLTDKNEWLIKGVTEESTHRPSRKKHNMPTQQQKRKHQITYLAFQAKERENDLKNQWASNSRTRRETQAKYGF